MVSETGLAVKASATAAAPEIAPVAPVLVTVAAQAGPTASAAAISRVAAVGTGMPSAEGPGDMTDRARVGAAVVVPPALDLAEEGSAVAAAPAVAAGAGRD